jgi:hypothetical protein
MKQAMTKSTWEPLNVSCNVYGHMRSLMNQAMPTGTWDLFNESSNDYGHKTAVQWINKWLREHEGRLMNKAMNTAHESRSMNQAVIKGTNVPINESNSN